MLRSQSRPTFVTPKAFSKSFTRELVTIVGEQAYWVSLHSHGILTKSLCFHGLQLIYLNIWRIMEL